MALDELVHEGVHEEVLVGDLAPEGEERVLHEAVKSGVRVIGG